MRLMHHIIKTSYGGDPLNVDGSDNANININMNKLYYSKQNTLNYHNHIAIMPMIIINVSDL